MQIQKTVYQMALQRILGKCLIHSNEAKFETAQLLYLSRSLIDSTRREPMQARWVHSFGRLQGDMKSNTEKSTSVPPIESRKIDIQSKINQYQELPHFRETLKKSSEHVQTESRVSPLDDNVHPDVLEARSMNDGGYRLPHPIWTSEEVGSVQITHTPPVGKVDKLAYYTVQALRTAFDIFSGYKLASFRGRLDEKQWIKRIIFLETVAGVPGMVGAMVRHLVSLRKLKRDHGWIHTLLEEAENERMHLMTAMRIGNPGLIMKSAVVLGQGVFVMSFSLAYLLSPRFCHRFVGYLEEEAVKTYTQCLKDLDEGKLKMWCRMKAPEIAVEYWKLPADAMMRDVILAIRADEAHHRTVNHQLSSQKDDDPNPYPPGE